MLTLVATHVMAPRPWLHHLVGWSLHLIGALFLYLAVRIRDESEGDWVALWIAALFLLHPVGVEAFVWIHGRSDLVAGVCLAALAALRPGRRLLSPLVVFGWIGLVFLGAAAKLTFIPAAMALWLGATLRAKPGARSMVALGAAVAVGAGAFLVLRANRAPFDPHIASGSSVLGAADLWAFFPKMIAKAVYATMSLRTEAMQSLAWSAVRPWGAAEFLGISLGAVFVVGLAWRRDWGGLAYLLGALATLAPTIVVTRAIWFGFDRYLYMPLILVLLAAAPYVRALVTRGAVSRPLMVFAACAILLIAGVNSNLASRAYADHLSFMAALVEARPDDPTVRLFVARELGARERPEAVRQAIQQLPGPPWPQAMIAPLIALSRELEDDKILDRTMTYAADAFGDDPLIAAHVVRWHHDRQRLDAALMVAARYPTEHPLCFELRKEMQGWLSAATQDARARIVQAIESLRCGR